MEPTVGFDMADALGQLTESVTSMIGEAAPLIFGVLVTWTLVNVGFKLYKKFSTKVG